MSGRNQLPAARAVPTESDTPLRVTLDGCLDDAIENADQARVSAVEELDWRGERIAALIESAIAGLRFAQREARQASRAEARRVAA